MKNYKVNITDGALADMRKIYEYIAFTLYSPDSAVGQYNRLSKAILKLEEYPERFPFFDYEPEHTWGLRKMVVDNFLVCYVVDDEVVTVTNVLYGASNVHERLCKK